LLLLFAGTAQAKLSQQECLLRATIYVQAAAFRDQGTDPKYAFEAVMNNCDHDGIKSSCGVTAANAKSVINKVYFDSRFVNAGGEALKNQMITTCMHPEGVFQPLK
jgi:hypothetical protein